MRRYLLTSAALVAAVCLLSASVRSEQPPGPREFMRAKLEHSQKVLEGLTVEDFEKMAKHSQELSLLSLATSWQVLQTPEYVQQSLEFRRAADALTNAARTKNLDGAALAYVDVTMKCVKCHKYVRGTRMAGLEQRGPEVPLGQFLNPATSPETIGNKLVVRPVK